MTTSIKTDSVQPTNAEVEIVKPKRGRLVDRLRQDIKALREQSAADKQHLARLVGAAAQIADNCDQVIEEAADTARDALEN